MNLSIQNKLQLFFEELCCHVTSSLLEKLANRKRNNYEIDSFL